MVNKAYLKELFSGIQGEGLWVGYRQIFLRFLGCDLRCNWCDTPESLQIKKEIGFKFEKKAGERNFQIENNSISLEKLCKLILSLENDLPHHSLSLTGGEPLLQADFIKTILSELKNNFDFKPLIFLETGGHKPKELEKIIDKLDFISFDLKLPSSTLEKPLWEEHKQFIEIAKTKKGYAKAVLTGETTMQDLEKACNLLQNTNFEIVLQIVSPIIDKNNYSVPSSVQIIEWQNFAINLLGSAKVRVMPQTHKFIGQL